MSVSDVLESRVEFGDCRPQEIPTCVVSIAENESLNGYHHKEIHREQNMRRHKEERMTMEKWKR